MKKISLISFLLILPACAPGVISPPVSTPTVIASNPAISPTPAVSATSSQTPTTKPTAYPLPANTNFNRKITYVIESMESHANLYVANPDGTGLIKLTNFAESFSSPSGVNHPIMTVDGTKIIYDTFEGMFQINIDGTENKKIFPLDQNISNFRTFGKNLSRDGRKLVFSYKGELNIYDLDTGTTKTISNNTKPFYPYFSPDSTKIVFFHEHSIPRGDDSVSKFFTFYQLYTINSDGSNLNRITNDTNSYTYPQWTPDGTKIFATHNSQGLYSMNPDGTGKAPLGIGAYGFSISPDGRKLAIGTSSSLHISDIDGSNFIKISDTDALSATWSPDSNKIAFRDSYDLYSINSDGTNLKKLTENNFAKTGFSVAGFNW